MRYVRAQACDIDSNSLTERMNKRSQLSRVPSFVTEPKVARIVPSSRSPPAPHY